MRNNEKMLGNIPPAKRLSNALFTLWKTSFAMKNKDEAKKLLIESLLTRIELIIEEPDINKKLLEIIRKEKDAPIETPEEWRRNLADKLSEEILKRYSLADMEKKLLDTHLKGGALPINKMFTYNIEDKDKTLRLHVPVIFPESPIEVRALINDAIQKLQDMLKNDKNLSKIETITMRSNLIFTHLGLVSRFGFKIIPVQDELEKAEAEISSEKFLSIDLKNLS